MHTNLANGPFTSLEGHCSSTTLPTNVLSNGQLREAPPYIGGGSISMEILESLIKQLVTYYSQRIKEYFFPTLSTFMAGGVVQASQEPYEAASQPRYGKKGRIFLASEECQLVRSVLHVSQDPCVSNGQKIKLIGRELWITSIVILP
jgi:hypothetical protein